MILTFANFCVISWTKVGPRAPFSAFILFHVSRAAVHPLRLFTLDRWIPWSQWIWPGAIHCVFARWSCCKVVFLRYEVKLVCKAQSNYSIRLSWYSAVYFIYIHKYMHAYIYKYIYIYTPCFNLQFFHTFYEFWSHSTGGPNRIISASSGRRFSGRAPGTGDPSWCDSLGWPRDQFDHPIRNGRFHQQVGPKLWVWKSG